MRLGVGNERPAYLCVGSRYDPSILRTPGTFSFILRTVCRVLHEVYAQHTEGTPEGLGWARKQTRDLDRFDRLNLHPALRCTEYFVEVVAVLVLR